jgi:hypothetical protein
MATEALGRDRRRPRLAVVIAALTLSVALFVVAAEARSILSTGTGVPAHLSQVAPTGNSFATVGHIPPGCRPKWGCGPSRNGGRP